MTTKILQKTHRTRLRRKHKRGHYDRATIDTVLDSTAQCHVGYIIDGSPICMPTIHWREQDHVYWHASSKGRGLKAAATQSVCLTVTQFDGFVLARSAINHSANFRSVMVFGEPKLITEPVEKLAKLRGMIEHLFPGRWEMLRPITTQELKATSILSLSIEEASCKIRAAGVHDQKEDRSLPIWAGIVPICRTLGIPEPDPHNLSSVEMPAHVMAPRI